MTEAALTRQRTGFWSAALTLSFAILVNRATTFLTQTVIAHRFGTSAFTDAYFAVEYVLLVVAEFVVIGFSAAFIPLWMEYKVRRGTDEAQSFANAAISLLTVATIALALFIAWAAPLFVRVVAPGFSDQAASMAGQLLTVTALAVVFLGLTAGCTAILEANSRFILPELSRVAYSAVILVAAIAFGGRFGLMALAWGTVIGSLVRLLVQLPNALKLGAVQLIWRFDHEGVRRLGRVLLPIFVAYAGMRVTLLLANVVASGLPEGAVSGLGYAVRVMLLPVGLLALPLRTTIFPTLSQNVAENQLELMGETALRGMRVIIFTTIPVSVGLIIFRLPLIQLLFQRGAFDSAAAQMTADILGWLALGLPAIGGLMIVNSIYFSLGSPVTLVKLNVVNWVAMLVISLALVGWFGENGVALAVALSTTIAFLMAILSLKRRLPNLAVRPLGETIVKAMVAAGLMVALLLALSGFLNGAFDPDESNSALLAVFALALGTFIGASTYALATWLLRMQEAHALVRAVSEWMSVRIAAK